MLTSILSAVCAIALSASPVTNRTDTVNTYVINGEKVVNFDGSQLVGKMVTDYKILTTSGKILTASGTGNNVSHIIKMHMIRTDGKELETITSSSYVATYCDDKSDDAKLIIIGSNMANESNVSVMTGAGGADVYVDGKKSSLEELKKISPDRIASITVYKAGSKEAMELTDDKSKKVIKIESKNESLYVINGKKSSLEEMKKINPNKIASITVYKAGSKEAAELTEDKIRSVIKIELKK